MMDCGGSDGVVTFGTWQLQQGEREDKEVAQRNDPSPVAVASVGRLAYVG